MSGVVQWDDPSSGVKGGVPWTSTAIVPTGNIGLVSTEFNPHWVAFLPCGVTPKDVCTGLW
jgi:hypothetical protein